MGLLQAQLGGLGPIDTGGAMQTLASAGQMTAQSGQAFLPLLQALQQNKQMRYERQAAEVAFQRNQAMESLRQKLEGDRQRETFGQEAALRTKLAEEDRTFQAGQATAKQTWEGTLEGMKQIGSEVLEGIKAKHAMELEAAKQQFQAGQANANAKAETVLHNLLNDESNGLSTRIAMTYAQAMEMNSAEDLKSQAKNFPVIVDPKTGIVDQAALQRTWKQLQAPIERKIVDKGGLSDAIQLFATNGPIEPQFMDQAISAGLKQLDALHGKMFETPTEAKEDIRKEALAFFGKVTGEPHRVEEQSVTTLGDKSGDYAFGNQDTPVTGKALSDFYKSPGLPAAIKDQLTQAFGTHGADVSESALQQLAEQYRLQFDVDEQTQQSTGFETLLPQTEPNYSRAMLAAQALNAALTGQDLNVSRNVLSIIAPGGKAAEAARAAQVRGQVLAHEQAKKRKKDSLDLPNGASKTSNSYSSSGTAADPRIPSFSDAAKSFIPKR
jgi:hypothetical protein